MTKIIILNQCTLDPLYNDVDKVMRETWQQVIHPNIKIINYYGSDTLRDKQCVYSPNDNKLIINVGDFKDNYTDKNGNEYEFDSRGEKFILALEYCLNNLEFDFIYRMSCTSYIDIFKMYDYINTTPTKEKVYNGTFNMYDYKHYFVSGFNVIMSKDIFSKVTDTVIQVSNIETAEMIKMVDNMQRDTHFAISNEVARMCNQVNVKASEVIAAGKNQYPRTNLPTPGPVGGPCLEKDTYLLNEAFNLSFSLSKTARMVNESIVDDSLDFFKEYFGKRISKNESNFRIAIIGLAFKGIPETNDLRGSVALKIINVIKDKFNNVEICGYDPVVKEDEIVNLKIQFMQNYEKAFENSDLVLFMNNHPQISEIKLEVVANKMKSGGMIYDYWGRFDYINHLPNNIVSSSWGSHGVLVSGEFNG